MHRVYLVSRGAHLAGWPEDGVRDAHIRRVHMRERVMAHDPQRRGTLPFGLSSSHCLLPGPARHQELADR